MFSGPMLFCLNNLSGTILPKVEIRLYLSKVEGSSYLSLPFPCPPENPKKGYWNLRISKTAQNVLLTPKRNL